MKYSEAGDIESAEALWSALPMELKSSLTGTQLGNVMIALDRLYARAVEQARSRAGTEVFQDGLLINSSGRWVSFAALNAIRREKVNEHMTRWTLEHTETDRNDAEGYHFPQQYASQQ
jgi:hypothetical protein